jgi:2-polyprenyl-6-methoxyphenol hydroxylase-like FAD-dependent oxidoreductase
VTVLGGGVAGLSAAVMMARDGHRVTLVERDEFDIGPAEDAPRWHRKGIPHFLQPHAFIPRGRAELREHLADVYTTLLEVGAYNVDIRPKIPGPARPGDEDLQYLAVRRPVIEWALRRAVRDEPRIDIRAGVHVRGFRVEHGRVTAVRVDGSDFDVDVLIDALGRRTPTAEWLAEAGIASPPAETSDCGVMYYSRYYQQRPGFELPDGPWFLSPRGDLGYLGWATFPGDNRTFAALLAVPTGAPEWRPFKEAKAFEAAVARIPALRQWVDPDGVDPITNVMPMAGLRNALRPYDGGTLTGLAPIGDALCHTDPVLAHGLAFALIHAGELAAALRNYSDLGDAFAAYAASTTPAVRERYDLASALDDQRHRMWVGEPVDITRHDGDYALFATVAAAAAATIDPDVCRVFVRRIGLLDSTDVLDSDINMQGRIEDLFRQLLASPRPPPGPSREEMLAVATSAVGS